MIGKSGGVKHTVDFFSKMCRIDFVVERTTSERGEERDNPLVNG